MRLDHGECYYCGTGAHGRRSSPPTSSTAAWCSPEVGALLQNLGQANPGGNRAAGMHRDDPLCCVVLGTSKILSNFKLLRRISIE